MGRTLSQHQAALTLLQSLAADPARTEIRWLDLACGRGQIISRLQANLPTQDRKRIHYFGFDINNDHVREAEKISKEQGFATSVFEIGELSKFASVVPSSPKFDFITLTNTVHEIVPFGLPNLLYECISRLSNTGLMYAYDMELLPKTALELGAIPWSFQEISSIVSSLYEELKIGKTPNIGQWEHSTCTGWSLLIHRQYLTEIPGPPESDAALEVVTARITTLLQEKLNQVTASLESLTRYGPESAEEAEDKTRYLYDYWALDRALRVGK